MKEERDVIPGSPQDETGFFRGLLNQVKLVMRLMGDQRVSPLLKALPIGALVYLVIPADLVPLMPLDDAVVIGAGLYAFVELCPDDVVAEHRAALGLGAMDENGVDDEVIEGEFTDTGEV